MIFRIIYHARKLYILSFTICCFVALSKQKLTFQPLGHQLYADREESILQPIKMFLCLATKRFVVVKGHIDTIPSNCSTFLGSAESVSCNLKKIRQVQDFVQTCCDDKMNATCKRSRSIHSRDGIGR